MNFLQAEQKYKGRKIKSIDTFKIDMKHQLTLVTTAEIDDKI